MNADQVVDKILSEARQQAEATIRQAQEREAAEQARLDGQMAQFEQESQTLAARAAEAEKFQRLAVARLEMAKEYLATKTAVLDEVFAQARQKIATLPENEYRDLMGRLMAEAVEQGDEEVVPGKGDDRVDQKLVDSVNAGLKADGKGNLTLSSEKAGIDGGFLLKRGKIRTNVSVDVLLERARTDLEMELAEDLFAKKGADASPAR